MSEDLTGSRLGHYKIEGVLGRGGMSVMYRATDVRLGRKVALKVMGEHITGDSEFRERFVDEARNTSAIDHANIVPLYDFGEVDGMLYIAMRLVEGSDLASLIAEGPMEPRRAVDLLGQVAEALDTLHEKGLVHLDLKPANVLVTSREASHEHVYLADFGLTRRGATGHRTSTGDFLGSPTYAAPEHLRGEAVDGRTDLYSLACMLYACLTGGPPFTGEVQEVIQGHLRTEAPRVTARVALPPAIDEVLHRGMGKTPEQRYDTCRELVSAAGRALNSSGEPRHTGGGAGAAPPVGPASGPQLVQSGPFPAQPVEPPSGPQPTAGGPMTGPPSGGVPRPGGAPGPGVPPPPGEPVRVRPPMPAQSTSFTRGSRSSARWVVPVVVIAAVTLLVVMFIIMVDRLNAASAPEGVVGTDGEPATVLVAPEGGVFSSPPFG
ncbi:serine/threonine-protein kinase [Actinopolyspora mortivallis]|uniref:non-specific serine/threonine protein kinase n=1 Tax=Actinopolyspora mortivallis TaxID=33906 RepID=A0A2T0GWS6_ACTMO|nr:serine/threonine-protein kinase [Actinopolyspora mortivallis]PRW63561.1 serine/threonine protein kinase [Actinopolyspora mortivallis]